MIGAKVSSYVADNTVSAATKVLRDNAANKAEKGAGKNSSNVAVKP